MVMDPASALPQDSAAEGGKMQEVLTALTPCHQ